MRTSDQPSTGASALVVVLVSGGKEGKGNRQQEMTLEIGEDFII
jgi:hypothetical protein